jgi:Cyclic nucleotide-binding domain
MYTLEDLGQEFAQYDIESKRLISELLSSIEPLNNEKLITSDTEALSYCKSNNCILLIKEGAFVLRLDKKILAFYNEGDLIGLSDYPCSNFESDFAVKVTVYDRSQFEKAVHSSIEKLTILNKLMTYQFQQLLLLSKNLLRSEVTLEPEIQHFSAGDIIIEQGTVTTDVCTLIEGKAEAYVDGVKVGEIKNNEIFGMLAAVTGAPRTAKVVASTSCMVATVPKEKFIELAQNKPQAIVKCIEDMARVITELNTKVVGLSANANNRLLA